MNLKINLDLLNKLLNLHYNLYYPVKNFMNKNQLLTVSFFNKYQSNFFPFPILFPVKREFYYKLNKNKKIKIYFNNKLVAIFLHKEKFKIITNKFNKFLFGTRSKAHPGVYNFFKMGNYFITGEIKYIFNRTKLYKKRNWTNTVSIATRNIPHLGHELIVKKFINEGFRVGITPTLNINMIDYKNSHVFNSWEKLIKLKIYENDTFLIPVFDNSSLAGPKEAALQAIIRRNIGFENFIVGRDHSGVKSYYKIFESAEFLKKFESQIKINILIYKGSVYCRKCNKIVENGSCIHDVKYYEDISSSGIKSSKSKIFKMKMIRSNLQKFYNKD